MFLGSAGRNEPNNQTRLKFFMNATNAMSKNWDSSVTGQRKQILA